MKCAECGLVLRKHYYALSTPCCFGCASEIMLDLKPYKVNIKPRESKGGTNL